MLENCRRLGSPNDHATVPLPFPSSYARLRCGLWPRLRSIHSLGGRALRVRPDEASLNCLILRFTERNGVRSHNDRR